MLKVHEMKNRVLKSKDGGRFFLPVGKGGLIHDGPAFIAVVMVMHCLGEASSD